MIYLKPLKINILRKIFRGRKVLKELDRLTQVLQVAETLTVEQCITGGVYSPLIFGNQANKGELIVRQFLLSKLAGLRLDRAIFYAFGNCRFNPKILFPFPPLWRDILEFCGFRVANVATIILWNFLVFYCLLRGFFSIGKTLIQIISRLGKRSNVPLGHYVFFDDLSATNIPSPKEFDESFDIISWYQEWSGRTMDLDSVCHTVSASPRFCHHGVSILPIQSPIPQPSKVDGLLAYLRWSISASFCATVDLFRGRWWHALMLSEASNAALCRISKNDHIARDYLFHNSKYIYRPLWTYEVEEKGSRIIFYFYATNIQYFKRKGFDQTRAYTGYKSMTWPYYLVWDQHQADFLDKIVKIKNHIEVVGPIWFNDNSNKIKLPSLYIAVFDVQPVRDSFYKLFPIEFDYYTPQVAIQFLMDIKDVLKEYDCTLVHKKKRELGKLTHPKFRNFLKQMANNKDFISINPNTSSRTVIQNCKAVISMPFTSTALIGREYSKFSVYYDPFSMLCKDDPAAHGIEILQGRKELRRWLCMVFEGDYSNALLHN